MNTMVEMLFAVKKMKRINWKKLLIPIFALLAVFAIAAVSLGLFSVYDDLADVPFVSIEHFSEADGTVAEVYGSGDQFYNYLHDKKGRFLVPRDGYLYYAKSEGGRPVATDVRWNATPRAVSASEAMTVSELDLEKNPDLCNDFGELDAGLNLSDVAPKTQVVNNIIFLRFADEPDTRVTEGVLRCFSNVVGQQDTLGDYFKTVSSGQFTFYNALPYLPDTENLPESERIFVYTAPQTKSYYQNVTAARRNIEEGRLLGAALAEAKPYLESRITANNLKTDSDGDGNVDSITFMVLSEEPGNDAWNTLLWPHQWNMGSIFVSDTVGNARADNYCFMFTTSDRFYAVLTHEMGHVLGAPDLYHYDNTYDPVAFYDNMCSSSPNSPNFWLTAMRAKYLADAVSPNQVEEITANWDGYTLKAVSAAGENDILAFKVRLSASEWLYLEYRDPTAGRYDKNFNYLLNSVSSGLVAYRVVEGVYGNNKAKEPTSISYSSNPDEICVYRKSSIYSAALNLKNPSIGSATDVKLYRNGNIYAKNGRNSGIVVTVKDIDAVNHSVRFEVSQKNFPDYGGSVIVGLSTSAEIETEVSETVTESRYGSDAKFSVYPIYQSGVKRYIDEVSLPNSLFTLAGFDKTLKSTRVQSATATFSPAEAKAQGYPVSDTAVFPTLSFSIRLTDYDESMTVIQHTESDYWLGTETGFVADWYVMTAMGEKRSYDINSPETEMLTYTDIDGTKTGAQTITVQYGEIETQIDVLFKDQADRLVLAEGTPLTYAFDSDVGDLNFEVVYRSGKRVPVAFSAASLGFSTRTLGAQTLSASYRDPNGAELNAKVTLTVYKTISNMSQYQLVKGGEKTPTAIALRYADVLNLTGYALKVRFDGDAQDTVLSVAERLSDPLKLYTSNGTVDLLFPEVQLSGRAVTITLRLTVAIRVNENLLTFRGTEVSVDYTAKLVVLRSPMTVQDLIKLARTDDGYLAVEVAGGALGSASGATLSVKNKAAGALQDFVFVVVLCGDANGDGSLNREDLDLLAALYVQDASALRTSLGDFNGDGAYDLTDFTLWIQKFSKGENQYAAA